MWIFVRRHNPFQDANSFPKAKLKENCEPQGTDNVQGQISIHTFAQNRGYCLFLIMISTTTFQRNRQLSFTKIINVCFKTKN